MNEKTDVQILKRLRAITGAGVGECKKALLEAHGDLEEAQKVLSALAKVKAQKKCTRPTTEGCFAVAIDESQSLGCVIEVRCETDFVSRHETFQSALQGWVEAALRLGASDSSLSLQTLQTALEEKRVELVQKTDENIQITQVWLMRADHLISYLHGDGKICLLASLEAKDSPLHPEMPQAKRRLAAQLALGPGPDLWSKEGAEFSVVNRGILEKITSHERSVWAEGPLFTDEQQRLGAWAEEMGLDVLGYARFSFSSSQTDLGQKFSEDVQALLSKYGQCS